MTQVPQVKKKGSRVLSLDTDEYDHDTDNPTPPKKPVHPKAHIWRKRARERARRNQYRPPQYIGNGSAIRRVSGKKGNKRSPGAAGQNKSLAK